MEENGLSKLQVFYTSSRIVTILVFSRLRKFCLLQYFVTVVVQSLRCIQLFATPWTIAHQVPLSSTISWSLFKFMFIESVVLSNHLILCHPLFLLPSIFPSIRVFSNEPALHIRWPKDWSFSFSISPSSEYSELISFRINWLYLLVVQGTLESLLSYVRLKSVD